MKKKIGRLLIISAAGLFILHLTSYLIITEASFSNIINLFYAYFASSIGLFLVFIGILILAGAYLLGNSEGYSSTTIKEAQ